MTVGFINILDAETSNKIAAGEVVERPSSAVKELMENSLDAGAKSITLEIKNGGKSLIRVTDDGSGFLREDMPKALLRHATSKLQNGDSVTGIRSLGFRGEALAAIGSVSRLELISKHRTETVGTRLTCDENGIVLCDTGCPDGTTAIVRDLYYNTPARQKFLKRDATEGASCVAVAEKMALSHPNVAFSVIADGERRFSTNGDGKLFDAIYEIFGREFAATLTPVSNDFEGISVRGYVSMPGHPRGSRGMQNFFVNGRYVKTKTAQAALEEACRTHIPGGKFPACILFIYLDHENVDVNVHPAKTEVKFASEQSVFRAVYYGIKNAFSQLDGISPRDASSEAEQTAESAAQKQEIPCGSTSAPQKNTQACLAAEKKSQNPDPSATLRAFAAFNPALWASEEETAPKTAYSLFDSVLSAPSREEEQIFDTASLDPKQVGARVSEQKTILPPTPLWRMIGQAYDAYLFVQTESEILVIDKHAAHERILYEKLASTKELHVQTLLAGIPLSVGRENAALLLDNKDFLAEKGFEIEDFGDGCIMLRTVPMSISKTAGLSQLMESFAADIAGGNGLSFEERVDKALFTVACKAALKAGIKNHADADERVVEMLMENPSLCVCPHGRPFVYRLKKREIEKHFDR